MERVLFFNLVVCCCWISGDGLDNGLGLTPQMGWNSWNHFACEINETIVRETADAMISTGLYKYGYKYINIDDCWAGVRSTVTGEVVPDTKTFPSGIASLASYVHSKGLLFGLYSDAGNCTCAGRPGSLGYEEIDAQTYAAWKVDYLKYDNCYNNDVDPRIRYPLMRDALNKTGRPIFYSLCEQGQLSPATWAVPVGNSWRTTGDIKDYWLSMIIRADLNDIWWPFAGRGAWNDPDMLEVGNGGMTSIEYEMHFTLWCMMKAPLLIGCDIRNMSSDTLRILTNSELIAVNQDPLGVQGHKVEIVDIGRTVWSCPLSDGSYAVALVNTLDSTHSITAQWYYFGLEPKTTARVRDLWKHEYLGEMVGSVTASVPGHGTVAYKITPV